MIDYSSLFEQRLNLNIFQQDDISIITPPDCTMMIGTARPC